MRLMRKQLVVKFGKISNLTELGDMCFVGFNNYKKFVNVFKAFPWYFLYLTKRKSLKCNGKSCLFHLRRSFGSWDILTFSNFLPSCPMFKIQRESCKWNDYDVIKWLPLVTNWNFWNNSKAPWIKASQIARWWISKERELLNILATWKVIGN